VPPVTGGSDEMVRAARCRSVGTPLQDAPASVRRSTQRVSVRNMRLVPSRNRVIVRRQMGQTPDRAGTRRFFPEAFET